MIATAQVDVATQQNEVVTLLSDDSVLMRSRTIVIENSRKFGKFSGWTNTRYAPAA
jgi:hypothetical protein